MSSETPNINSEPVSQKINRQEILRVSLETILNVIVIFAIVFSIRYSFISPFRVSGNSMQDNLQNEDFILVARSSYWFSDPEYGDVVVLHPPSSEENFYVKRVIGAPGDTIEFNKGNMYIYNDQYPNGNKLPNDYLTASNSGNTYLPNKQNARIALGVDEYFVVGDNRRASSDSRSWYTADPSTKGAVSLDRIVGKAWVDVLPTPQLIDDLK
ncbi:MAG: signal peptidase I [Patescibacteria group bacterium]|nr:signal peptidase I [Patescibacteria group bacterium]